MIVNNRSHGSTYITVCDHFWPTHSEGVQLSCYSQADAAGTLFEQFVMLNTLPI